MIEVFEMVRKVARHYTNILLIGATGVGKELIAKSIHQNEPGGAQTFRGLQLFGHGGYAAGKPALRAYAGVLHRRHRIRALASRIRQRRSRFFSMKWEKHRWRMQAKLLRVIQNRKFNASVRRKSARWTLRLIGRDETRSAS